MGGVLPCFQVMTDRCQHTRQANQAGLRFAIIHSARRENKHDRKASQQQNRRGVKEPSAIESKENTMIKPVNEQNRQANSKRGTDSTTDKSIVHERHQWYSNEPNNLPTTRCNDSSFHLVRNSNANEKRPRPQDFSHLIFSSVSLTRLSTSWERRTPCERIFSVMVRKPSASRTSLPSASNEPHRAMTGSFSQADSA